MTDEELQAIKKSIEYHAEEIPSGLYSGQVVLEHARTLLAEVARLRAEVAPAERCSSRVFSQRCELPEGHAGPHHVQFQP
jgi:hypothetical protein